MSERSPQLSYLDTSMTGEPAESSQFRYLYEGLAENELQLYEFLYQIDTTIDPEQFPLKVTDAAKQIFKEYRRNRQQTTGMGSQLLPILPQKFAKQIRDLEIITTVPCITEKGERSKGVTPAGYFAMAALLWAESMDTRHKMGTVLSRLGELLADSPLRESFNVTLDEQKQARARYQQLLNMEMERKIER